MDTLNELGRWVDAVHAAAPPDTPLGRAITYLQNQWHALVRFLEDGRLRLTNNDAERQRRHIALGRNAWLFTGSDAGGERLAMLYTCVDPRLDVGRAREAHCRLARLATRQAAAPAWAAAQKALEQVA